jgi:hypothetical protein
MVRWKGERKLAKFRVGMILAIDIYLSSYILQEPCQPKKGRRKNMFSAKKLVDELHPYERSTLIAYIARPYVLKVGTELGIDWTGHGRLKMSLADVLDLVIKQVRLLCREREDLRKRNSNQTKELERRAQIAFTFMNKHNETKSHD